MIYIETGSEDIFYNLSAEHYFAAQKKLGDTAFLIWRTTPTLVVGKYQNTLEEIRQDYADRHGIQVARRLSGGGTVYADRGGWMFTFIQPDDTAEISFRQYTQPIVDALRALGVPAGFNGRNDLMIEGRKFSGNAQYKLAGSTVHHGTLMFDVDIEQMVAATTVADEKIISKSIHSVRERVTNIADHLKTPMDAEAFKQHLIRFVMGENGARYEPDEADRAEISRFAREKLATWDWRYGKNPKFSITRANRFPGGRIEFRLEVKDGLIAGAAVSGDFFAGEKADGLAAALTGCRYDRRAVRDRLAERGFDGVVYGITIDDMAATIAD
ncbi:MAG: lipoate--protein ligase [Clostridia bacterium]|nr:lipoate--protein ligase [Clostridia bacterium]